MARLFTPPTSPGYAGAWRVHYHCFRLRDYDVTEEQERSYRGLTIIRGKRHCKIIDKNNGDEVVFRTTNLRDAEEYLNLLEEKDRLQALLDARGIAPHRIYLLAVDESKRGRVNQEEQVAASEVVIVAKANDDAVVVRHLNDGREEIVDLEEIDPIEGGSYLQGPDVTDESVHLVLYYDRETEAASVAAFREAAPAENLVGAWSGEDAPGNEYSATLIQSEGDVLLFRAEASLED